MASVTNVTNPISLNDTIYRYYIPTHQGPTTSIFGPRNAKIGELKNIIAKQNNWNSADFDLCYGSFPLSDNSTFEKPIRVHFPQDSHDPIDKVCVVFKKKSEEKKQ